MGATIILVTKPFSLGRWLFMSSLRMIIIAMLTLVELSKSSIMVHLNIFRKTMIWLIALVSLPLRVLTALQRERLLEEHLHGTQIELDNLLWEKKEVSDQLHTAIKERRILESMLAEVEEENDKAFTKIELLEAELQDIKDENHQLKEIQDSGCWDFRDHDVTDEGPNIGVADKYGISDGMQTQESGYKGNKIILQDQAGKDEWKAKGKSNPKLTDFSKARSKTGGSIHPFAPYKNSNMNEMDKRRQVALSQSFFSAALSLSVGMIIWQAEDPCMPLVVALFTVVGMSLKSVVQFLSTVENKPASDAVALLSFNWFILGTLTYPTLPRIARMLAPLAAGFFDWTVSWLSC